jgi:hypothetical protein
MSDYLYVLAGTLPTNDNSLGARTVVLIGFLVGLFAVAGLALWIGQRAARKRSDKAITQWSNQTKGTKWADDEPDAGADWWGDTASDTASSPSADSYLGPDSDELGNVLSGVDRLPQAAPASTPQAAPTYGRTRPARASAPASAVAKPAPAPAPIPERPVTPLVSTPVVPAAVVVEAPVAEPAPAPLPWEVDELADEPTAEPMIVVEEAWTSTASSFDVAAVREVTMHEVAKQTDSPSEPLPWEVDELAEDVVEPVAYTPVLTPVVPVLPAVQPDAIQPIAIVPPVPVTPVARPVYVEPTASTRVAPVAPVVALVTPVAPVSYVPANLAPAAPVAPSEPVNADKTVIDWNSPDVEDDEASLAWWQDAANDD